MGIKTKEGATRFYFKEETPAERYPGVTSIIGMLNKPFLPRWNGNMTADLALDSIDYLQRMADRDRAGAKKWLAGAAWRYTDQRSKIGSQAHDMFERMIRGESMARVHMDMVPYHSHFAEFLDAVQPELVSAEDVAWSDTHRYAGSFDAILRLRLGEDGRPDPQGESKLVMVDWKTSKSAWPTVALQMSAYAYADKIIGPDGVEEPMPEFDGAAVLHITDTAAQFLPVRIDRDKVFAHFLHLRESFDWEHDVSKTVLGKPLWRSGGALVTGTQRRSK
ncbi:hypothetical protein [Streptomyces sp. NPDC055006]